MKSSGCGVLIAIVLLSASGLNAQTVDEGARLYRSKCSHCHGVNAQGYRAPDLTTGRFKRAGDDAQLAAIIRNGIPGTAMAASNLADADSQKIVVYLRSLAGPARIEGGNPRNGETLFFGKGNCSKCHRVGGRGGRFGPDLTLIARMRSKPALVREIRTPSEVVPEGYQVVVAVTKSGETINGLRKAEDPFSLQMLDSTGELRAFRKTDLQSVRSEPASMMPEYGPDKISDTELNDVLSYLAAMSKTPGDRQ
jgi:cytochrome c oxidase cbb3-type subunit III